LTSATKIAIKTNILNPNWPPHPLVIKAMVEGLQQMQMEGKNFPAANLYIYDANNQQTWDTSGYKAEYFPGVNLVHHGYTLKNFGDGSHNNSDYAETLNLCDYLINVPNIRGHKPHSASVTLGFKSHYGTYPATYHDEKTQAYLQEINCTGPVFKKTVLTVFAAIFGLKEGHGPTGEADDYVNYARKMDPTTANPAVNTVLMSTDPVTAEYIAVKIMRLRDDKPYTVKTMPKYLKASAGLKGIMEPTYNIGVINEKKMDVRKIINGKVI